MIFIAEILESIRLKTTDLLLDRLYARQFICNDIAEFLEENYSNCSYTKRFVFLCQFYMSIFRIVVFFDDLLCSRYYKFSSQDNKFKSIDSYTYNI